MAAVFFVQTIELLDVFRLAFDIKGLRRGSLHAVGKLEALDPRIQLALDGRPGERAAVEIGQEIQLGALTLRGERRRNRKVVDGIAFRFQPGALIDARQETRAPVCCASLGQAAIERIAHHDKGRQRIALAAEAVIHP